MSYPTQLVPGFEYPCSIWTALNHIKKGQGRCNYLMYNWGMVDSPLYKYGQAQTIRHIVEECPEEMFNGRTAGKGNQTVLNCF